MPSMEIYYSTTNVVCWVYLLSCKSFNLHFWWPETSY